MKPHHFKYSKKTKATNWEKVLRTKGNNVPVNISIQKKERPRVHNNHINQRCSHGIVLFRWEVILIYPLAYLTLKQPMKP